MPDIKRIWIAMHTRKKDSSGTDSPIVLIINQDGEDVLHETLPHGDDSPQSDQEAGRANLYMIGAGASRIDTDRLATTYIRVGIRGGDMWEPADFFIWGETDQVHLPSGGGLGPGRQVVALGLERNIRQPLSTETDEGNISLPISKARTGTPTDPIDHLFVILTTQDKDDAGTDDTINLQISDVGGLRVDFDFPHDLERGEASFYIVPILGPNLSEKNITDMRLSTSGNDSWGLDSFFLFGVDLTSHLVVPIVREPSRMVDLSIDAGEGVNSIVLDKS